MRPSSNWRKQIYDGHDIFGNKKRGGGGDPVRNAKILNIPVIKSNEYKLLSQNTNQSPQLQSAIPPHLQSSIDLSYYEPNANKTNSKKYSDELFRQQLEQQITDKKKQKYLQKMQEIEQEKLFQAKYEKELQELHSKHTNEMNNESNATAGFLRYKTSHSHIPPNNMPSNDKIVEEIKETEPQIEYKSINDNNQMPNSMKSLEMQLLKQRLVWERKMSEQELELKKLKLQMLEQQNDQKTTLQYLLKLQTDFTEQIQNNNKNNSINIRRPLSALKTSIDSSSYNIPNITRPPQSPQTPDTAHTLLHQMQQSLASKQVQDARVPLIVNTNHLSPPVQYKQQHYNINNNNNNIVEYLSQSPQQNQAFINQNQQQKSSNIVNISPQESNYFPRQQITSNRSNTSSNHSNNNFYQQRLHMSNAHSSIQASPIKHIVNNNNNNFYNPIKQNENEKMYEEQKQESMLVCTDDNEINNVLLDTESSFLIVSDCEIYDDIIINKQLNSSTQFKLSSRPTTAISNNVINESKQIEQSDVKKEEIKCESSSYSSSFGNEKDEQKQDDPFTVHVVVDVDKMDNQNDDKWKEISDIDRNNVESLRDALEEMSNEEFNVNVCNNNVEQIEKRDDKIEEIFVVNNIENKENEQDNETDYEQDKDFEIESEKQQNEKQTKDVLRLPDIDASINNFESKDVLRLPDIDASINNFESKVYSVYSSFDDTLMTNSVYSSSDFSNKSPNKATCKTITE